MIIDLGENNFYRQFHWNICKILQLGSLIIFIKYINSMKISYVSLEIVTMSWE